MVFKISILLLFCLSQIYGFPFTDIVDGSGRPWQSGPKSGGCHCACVKSKSGTDVGKTDYVDANGKTIHVADNVKTDYVDADGKVIHVADNVKAGKQVMHVTDKGAHYRCSCSLKTEHVADNVKTEHVADNVKTEHVADNVKTEHVADNVKTEHVADNVKCQKSNSYFIDEKGQMIQVNDKVKGGGTLLPGK